MNDTRKRRFGVIAAVSAVALVLGATASAGLIVKETFHDEGPPHSTTFATWRG